MIAGSARILVNLESLNGVESVGNLVRHRTAPVVIRTGDGDYVIRYVPAISGESLAHAYQMGLVDLADSLSSEGIKLPVSKRTRQGELIKFANEDFVKEEGIELPTDESHMRKFEVDVMLKDFVADVGGFMFAPTGEKGGKKAKGSDKDSGKSKGAVPVRRSSKIMFGYMIPALGDGEIPAQLEAQFHVRYQRIEAGSIGSTGEEKSYPASDDSGGDVSSSDQGGSEEAQKQKQAIYNVEVGSALYTFSFALEDESVAIPSNYGSPVKEKEEELGKQKELRREAAIKGLYYVLSGQFGGKRSRFLPSMQLQSLVVTRTDFPFLPEPGHSHDYAAVTYKRLNIAKDLLGGKTADMFIINNEGLKSEPGIQCFGTAEELIEKLLTGRR